MAFKGQLSSASRDQPQRSCRLQRTVRKPLRLSFVSVYALIGEAWVEFL